MVAAGGRAGSFSAYIPGWGEPDVVGGGDHDHQREEVMMASLEILDPTVEPRRSR